MLIEGHDYPYKRLHRYVEISRALIHKPRGSFFHFSFLTKGSKTFSIGWNNIERKSRLVDYPLGGMHSEAFAVGELDDLNECKNMTLINVRINRRGEIRNSCPCDVCLGFIKSVGIKKVFHTTNDGFTFLDLRRIK